MHLALLLVDVRPGDGRADRRPAAIPTLSPQPGLVVQQYHDSSLQPNQSSVGDARTSANVRGGRPVTAWTVSVSRSSAPWPIASSSCARIRAKASGIPAATIRPLASSALT